MSKMQYLLSGGNTNGDIIPQPDLWIIHEQENMILVHGPEMRTPHEVIEFVQSNRKGSWMLGLWENKYEIDGELCKTKQTNPHQNNMGMYVWLMVKG